MTRKQTARKPSIEIEASITTSNKLPPDPIVTISKVQNNAGGAVPGGHPALSASSAAAAAAGTSLLKSSAPKSSSPALARSSAPSIVANSNVASTLNSLASILGQPRMSTAPPSTQPRFPGKFCIYTYYFQRGLGRSGF